jgi:hypothetical protein
MWQRSSRLLDPTTTGLIPIAKMPPRRTFSDVNRELQSVKATADRLRRERNETKENLDALGKKYKNVKKALKGKFLLCFYASSPIITRYYAS